MLIGCKKLKRIKDIFTVLTRKNKKVTEMLYFNLTANI